MSDRLTQPEIWALVQQIKSELVHTNAFSALEKAEGQFGPYVKPYVSNPNKVTPFEMMTDELLQKTLDYLAVEAGLIEIYRVPNLSSQLALNVKRGDVCVRTDERRTYIALNRINKNISADWQEILTPQVSASNVSAISRSQISDFWSAPFWELIPDKPLAFNPSAHVQDWSTISGVPVAFTPSAHAITHQTGGTDPVKIDILYSPLGASAVSVDSSLNLSINNARVINVSNGINPLDAVNKSQLDAVSSGIVWLDPVIGMSAAPPGSPVNGDRYIITTGTGAWSGHNNSVTQWNGSAWTFTSPATGNSVWVNNLGAAYNWNGTSWVKITGQYSHANLTNIQGGTTGDYQHLTTSQVATLHVSASVGGAPLSITGQQISFGYDVNTLAISSNNLAVKAGVFAPYSHAANSSVYGYGDTTNAGHLRVGNGLNVSNGTVSVVYGTSINTACVGNDSRLSDARTPVAHQLDGPLHTVSGLTTGHFLKALSPTSFGFAAHGLNYFDVNAAPTNHAVNAATYGYGDATNAGHLRVGNGLNVSSGTISVAYGSIANTACVGNDSRLSDARTPLPHNHPWSQITSTPTTLAGYGITDAFGAWGGYITAQLLGIFQNGSQPDYFYGQFMAGSDYMKIYGEGLNNAGRLVFEVGDDGDESFIWRQRRTYNTPTSWDIMSLGYGGLFLTMGFNGAVASFQGLIGSGSDRILKFLSYNNQYAGLSSQNQNGLETALVLNPSGGFVGVGAVSPASVFHVKGGFNGRGQVYVEGNNTHGLIDINTSGTNNWEQGLRFYNNGVHQAEIYTANGDRSLRLFTGADRLIIEPTGSIWINQTSGLPLRIGNQTGFQIYVDQASSNITRYYPIGYISSNNGNIHIHGYLGGHSIAQGRAVVDISISLRDGAVVSGTCAGSFGSSDIHVYFDGVNSYGVYLVTSTWSLVNIDARATSGAGINFDGTYQTSTPSGVYQFSLSSVNGPVRISNDGKIGVNTTNIVNQVSLGNAGGVNSVYDSVGLWSNCYYNFGHKYLNNSGKAMKLEFNLDSGLWIYGNNTESASAGSAVSLSSLFNVSHSGKVGIGSPADSSTKVLLHVNGTSLNPGLGNWAAIRIEQSSVYNYNYWDIAVCPDPAGPALYFGNLSSERLVGFYSNGLAESRYYSINTIMDVNNPLARLTVYDQNSNNDLALFYNQSVQTEIWHGVVTGGIVGSYVGTKNNMPFFIGVNGASHFILQDQNGDVGIDTINGDASFDVNRVWGNTVAKFGTTSCVYIIQSDPIIGFNAKYYNGWKFGRGSNNWYAADFGFSPSTGIVSYELSNARGYEGNGAAMSTIFQVSRDTFLMNGGIAIDGLSQNTGSIASNQPNYALSLGGSNSGEAIGSKRNAGGNQYGIDFFTNYTNRMSITNNGRVGIGTQSPSEIFEVIDGTIKTTGPEGKYVALITGGLTNSVNQFTVATRYGWYNEYWDVGAYRGASTNIGVLSFRCNGSDMITVDTLGRADFVAGGGIYLRGTPAISFLNKASSGWLTFATRNTTGAEAVFDLANIGNLSVSGNATLSGYVGIRTSPNASFALDVSGSSRINGSLYLGSSTDSRFYKKAVGEIATDSNFWVSANTLISAAGGITTYGAVDCSSLILASQVIGEISANAGSYTPNGYYIKIVVNGNTFRLNAYRG